MPSNLYIIHLALMLGPALFATVVYLAGLSQNQEPGMPKEQAMILQVVCAALTVVGVGLSQLIPQLIMRDDKHVPLQKYVSMKIVQWALIEGPAMFMGVVFFLTHDKNMLIPLGILIAVLAFTRPTVDELIRYNIKG